ncbi:MAG: DUF1697 domain-containing protein [Acidimicrobiales bacterium]|nr:DUF1697 domain-containing protein [Acidimicrobiales bacterium]
MSAHLALLRAVNLGSHGKVPMADLRAWLTDLGYGDVATHLQSGNAVFTAEGLDEDAVAAAVGDAIEAGCGVRTPVLVRGLADLEAVVAETPFGSELAAGDPKFVHVAFLSAAPDAERVAALDPARSPGDRAVVVGRHVHLHYPNGSGRSKLTNDYLERTLGVTSTARNWNTVLAVRDLLAEREAR